jgi:hypothetical protein
MAYRVAAIILMLIAIVAPASSAPDGPAEPALPPHFSGVWCYDKYASEEATEDVDIHGRAEAIPDCANRGGFTIWPNGRGYTFGRFNVVRNSCEFERVDLIETSGKGETYEVRVACDNSGEDADDPEDRRIKHIDLIIQYVITGYDGDEDLIISNPSKVKH